MADAGGAFALGASSTVIGLPGAFPYFAAIDQILRADASTAGAVALLLFYNGVFLLPLLAIPLLRAAFGRRADAFSARFAPQMERWGHRLVVSC